MIIISIDTLRADHLPAYGYRGVATPAIDAFRADAVLFTNAYSQCPLTLPSHVSMLTGLYPAQAGVRDNLGYAFDSAAHPTIPTLLKGRGYATGAAVSAYVLRGASGLSRAFDSYDDAIDVQPGEALGKLQRTAGESDRHRAALDRVTQGGAVLLFPSSLRAARSVRASRAVPFPIRLLRMTGKSPRSITHSGSSSTSSSAPASMNGPSSF